MNNNITVALAGNPNVGKSTIFNALTGMNQHTGNWAGKTVGNALGYCKSSHFSYTFVDIPGTYSLMAHSPEEEVARDFLCSDKPQAVVVVCDATCLERNLNLVLQTMGICKKVIVCVNLLDQAKRKKIKVDLEKLEQLLGVSVVGTCGHKKQSLKPLLTAIDNIFLKEEQNNCYNPLFPSPLENIQAESIVKKAEEIAKAVVSYPKNYHNPDRKLDKIFTSKTFGFPIMLLFLAAIFWITITGANYPSALLTAFFGKIENWLSSLFLWLGAPHWLYGSLVLGVYRTLSWVVAVMLPPMAIFFPLFTLLEDAGFLPRIAFNLDKPFERCNACGKQALTMCMGFGCNAVGVTGCRIIDSKRERLLAILTNCFVPCNGRFPAIIAIITIFFVLKNSAFSSIYSAIILTFIILFAILMTFFITKILSATVLKGAPSSYTLELPPYRKPQFTKVIVRSVLDRTLFVLGRSVIVAAPAGLVIWVMANITVGDTSVLQHCALFLDPFAKLLGLDGAILLGFILGLPANEIVIPIIIMTYMNTGALCELSLTAMRELFISNGWTLNTAISVILFSLFHWPCATTILTIKKETGSIKWTAFAVIMPTALSIIVCMVFNFLSNLI
ncbi:MAG: ferrous iron transporter B [Ruminococcaceae bacterium]|nr:ferrous iron transporter B [Oscillospiraceae bacterium]